MSTKTYRLMRALVLANILSAAAVSAASATDGPPVSTGDKNGHASAAPACGDQCPVLAGDTGPGGIGDDNGRSVANATARSGQVPALWGPVMASAEGLGSAGDQSGRGAAGGRGGIGGDI
jgi:hypothetical protein